MAAITLPRPIMTHRSSGLGAMSGAMAGAMALDTLAPPMPNKHIPACPPGSPRSHDDDDHTNGLADGSYDSSSSRNSTESSSATTSSSTSSSSLAPEPLDASAPSLLYPPTGFTPVRPSSLANWMNSTHPGPYEISAAQLAAAIDHAARQPLPEPSMVFPWLHGLHPLNRIQQAFFVARRRSLRNTPTCMRGIAIVKADGNLTASRLKGAVAWAEIMELDEPQFRDADPKDGFCIRNFHIQVVKAAVTSDIVIYGEDVSLTRKLGWDAAAAQHRWRIKQAEQGHMVPEYNTFVCICPFEEFEQRHADVVAIDSRGRHTGNVVDLFMKERKEMYMMTTASEISHNVWLGPTPDSTTNDDEDYDVLIECSDLGHLDPTALRAIAESSGKVDNQHFIELPASGSIPPPPAWSQAEADGILEACKWLYAISHGIHPDAPEFSLPPDVDAHVTMTEADLNASRPAVPEVRPRRVLIHCADGYTETTMFAVAYHSYSTGLPIYDAWLDLHANKRRDCFAYPADVTLLNSMATRLIFESPLCGKKSLLEITHLMQNAPLWYTSFDGSFPSRVLDYMYLGNLKHANNPQLLKAIGIGQILSVGETATWSEEEAEKWGADNVCSVRDVQDNGIDPLTSEFQRCLDFIDRGRKNGTATLVHCRVGVSRSATICIAEVMRTLDLSFPRAYCFVRARRLNVIIQPHLRFAYELLKWEELLQRQKQQLQGTSLCPLGYKRELEWSEIAREIARMNRPYSR